MLATNGEILVCQGDTVFLTLLSPNDTLIRWFRDNEEISDENSSTLVVLETGQYTASAAPTECPNFIQNFGVQINVIFRECTTGVGDPNQEQPVSIYPNPATNQISLFLSGATDQITELQLP